MKLADVLKRKSVLPDLKASTRDGILKEMVDALVPGPGERNDKLFEILKIREDQSPTAIKDGVAIPHGRVQGQDEIFMGFGRSVEGVPFGAPDGKPTHIFFLIFAPQNSAGEHLKILARIARLCRDAGLRQRLLHAGTADEIYGILMEEDKKL